MLVENVKRHTQSTQYNGIKNYNHLFTKYVVL